MNVDPMELPKAAAWRASFGGEAGLFDYLAQEGGATRAVAFAALFWPTFVEVRGCIVWRERLDSANFERWWVELNGRRAEIEATINHLHLWDPFDPSEEQVSSDAISELAAVLARTWAAALRDQFPDLQFEVSRADDPDEYGPTLTVRTIRRS
jgi:hypothetical protein